jgi:hypothetical protein
MAAALVLDAIWVRSQPRVFDQFWLPVAAVGLLTDPDQMQSVLANAPHKGTPRMANRA